MRKHDVLLVSEDKEKTKKEANFYNGSLSFGIIVFRVVVKKDFISMEKYNSF